MAGQFNPTFVAQSPDDVTMRDVSMLSDDAHDDENAYDLIEFTPHPSAVNRGATGANSATDAATATSIAMPSSSSQRMPLTSIQAAAFGKRRPSHPLLARPPGTSATTRGLTWVGARGRDVLGPDNRTSFKPLPFPRRHSPLNNSMRVFGDRPAGRGYFTSSTNRAHALHSATSGLLSTHSNGFGNNRFTRRYAHHNLFGHMNTTHIRRFPLSNDLFDPNSGSFNPYAGPFAGRLITNNASSALTRKRSLDDEGHYVARSRTQLRIDPPKVRRRRRELLFGDKRPSGLDYNATTAFRSTTSPTEPHTHSASTVGMMPTTWTPSDQLHHEAVLTDEARHNYVPGSFPAPSSPLVVPDRVSESASNPTENEATPENETSVANQAPMMSGALAVSPNDAAPREVVPISPVGTTIPAEYTHEPERPDLPRVDPMQNPQSSDNASWVRWYGTTAVHAFNRAVSFADSVKRRAVSYFVGPRPVNREQAAVAARRETPTPSPRNRNLRGFSEEDRRRLRSDQYRRERGLPTRPVEYPFPELSFDIPRFPIADDASRALVHPSDNDVSVSADQTPHAFQRPRSSQETRQTLPQLTSDIPRFPDASVALPSTAIPSSTSSIQAPHVVRRLSQETGESPRHRKRHAVDANLPVNGVKARPARSDTEKRMTKKKKKKQKNVVGAAERREPSRTKQKTERMQRKPSADAMREAETPLVSDLAPHLKSPASLRSKETVPKVVTEKEHKLDKKIPTKEQEHSIFDPFNPGEAPEFPFGPAVSAVRLFSAPRRLPLGRTESIYAAKWRRMEEKRIEDEKATRATRVWPEGVAVRPLPAGWAFKLSQAMTLPNGRQVATSISGDPLTKKDLLTCYSRNTWLNDEVINAYLALIVDYLRRSVGNAGRHDKPRFHAFNSFFFSNLRDKGYQSVRRWATRAKIGGKDLLNVDTVFVPVHNADHWTLIVVKPSDRTIEHFDSLGSVSQRHVATVKEWLRNELGALYAEDEWAVLPSASPRQNNGVDCGVFLLSTAKAVALGLDPQCYDASNIATFRTKIVAELMNGGFEGDFDPAAGGNLLL